MQSLSNYTLTTFQIAKMLGYHVQYVRFLASEGQIPALKRGREWKFNEQEVLAHFKKQTDKVLAKGTTNNVDAGDIEGSEMLR